MQLIFYYGNLDESELKNLFGSGSSRLGLNNLTKMRVLLIPPTFNYKYSYPAFLSNTDFPAGFAYIASALRNAGHEIFGLNLNNDSSYHSAYEMVYDKINRSLQEIQPELIGLGGLCTDFQFIKDALQIIRKLEPNIPIVCGGGIINNDAEFIFNTLRPDFCIIGEGEEILVQLANMLESSNKDYEQIVNLGYWEKDTAKFTNRNFNYIDINKRCFPDYESFGIEEMLDKYSMAARYLYRYTRPNPRPMTIVTARGCPFSCTFCTHQKGPKYRPRSVENIIQEITFLYEQYRFNILIILDELFAVNKPRLKEFCLSILESRETLGWDFDWLFQTHASASFDREVLEMAKKAGCYFFSYGLESASPLVLSSMNKKTKPSQIIQAIETANSVEIGFGGNFIFGDVAETIETICETMDFFSRYCLDVHIYFGSIRPYPGSMLFEKSMERGLFGDKLAFYEHIDEPPWNMTSIPNKLWLPWRHLMGYLSARFLWAKSTKAYRCVEETETTDNPMVSHSGKSIYKIWAKCPYCSKDIYCRELLEIAATQKTYSFFETFKQIILKIFLMKYEHPPKSPLERGLRGVLHNKSTSIKLKIAVKKTVLFLSSPRHPLLKTLKPIMGKVESAPSFITGCLHCNKRIKINIPPNSNKSEKNF